MKWYRRHSWSKNDRRSFFDQLGRVTDPETRAGYLRAQAETLRQRGDASGLRAGVALLDLLIADCPEGSHLAAAHAERASCLADLGDPGRALAGYRRACHVQREIPDHPTEAWLAFGWLAVERRLSRYYPEAVVLLDEFRPSVLFPADRYRLCAILAHIYDHQGEAARAHRYAKKALQALAQAPQGLPHHPLLPRRKRPDPILQDLRSMIDQRRKR